MHSLYKDIVGICQERFRQPVIDLRKGEGEQEFHMLFWSGDTVETRGLGLRNWQSITEAHPEKEHTYVAHADKRWRRFLDGKRKSKVVLFESSDAEPVSLSQRADAEVKY